MRQAVIDIFYQWSKQFEGEVPWMYLDCKGLVTCGVGNLIDPMSAALNLPWVQQDGTPATRQEIQNAWTAVKTHQELAKRGYRAAAAFCPLRLTPEGIDTLVRGKLAANWTFMQHQYPKVFKDCEQWPARVQLAVSGMAWAVGAGFPGIFKNWAQFATVGDWVNCSKTCEISAKNNPGIIPRNKAIVALFQEAAANPDQVDTI